MAYLSRKGDSFVARFSYQGQEYKRSLKTRDRAAAQAAIHQIELTMHRLLTGQLDLPSSASVPEFILSGGKRQSALTGQNSAIASSTDELVQKYLASAKSRISPTYLSSQRTHLNHLRRFLGKRMNQPVAQITTADLTRFVDERLQTRDANTVSKERITLVQFFKWCVSQQHLAQSPAEQLQLIKAGREQPEFRTKQEIQASIERQGLSTLAAADEWNRLYLATSEIAELLALVEQNSRVRTSYLLHAIPAFTGMRRGEVLRLCWADVDLRSLRLVARSRKQSRTLQEVRRSIEIHERLAPILADWQRQSSRGQYVVCDPTSLKPLEPNVANRLFWQPLRGTDWCLDTRRNWFKIGFHTYRHSFASNLAAAGVDQRVIDEFMGHTTEEMRKRYRHLFPHKRRGAIESLRF